MVHIAAGRVRDAQIQRFLHYASSLRRRRLCSKHLLRSVWMGPFDHFHARLCLYLFDDRVLVGVVVQQASSDVAASWIKVDGTK